MLKDNYQPVVVLLEHFYIKVVIPRNEALVTDGSQHGASGKPVTESVFAAYPVDNKQQFEHAHLHNPKGGAFGIEFAA